MTISCSCDYDEGILTVGYPKEVTCRTARKCSTCFKPISVNDKMYRWSMYDYDNYQTVAPWWLCESCGDMALNLMVHGFCFDLGESIRDQWLEYLWDINDPAYEIIKKEEQCQTIPTIQTQKTI